jgi:exopolyphosphatase/guanosine-5'-triphosphate,3'-diphosphate pyrophosphatase
MSKPRLAAIDAGTNSFHLIITEVDTDTGNFKILGREREIVRLGSSSSDMKFLTPDAAERGIKTLKRFKGLADAAGAEIRAVATSAVREALNRDEFIKRVKNETGIKLEVASGDEEARFIYLGVLQSLPVYNDTILLIDIGGGSTEFLAGQKRGILYDNSLKLGAIRLTKRFFPSDEYSNGAVKECRRYIRGTMNPVTRQLRRFDFDTVVGSSGTILNVANIIHTSKNGDTEIKLNNFSFSRDELAAAIEEIIEADTIKKKSRIPGLDSDRADIITAGALILEQVFRELKIKRMVVSEYALREGLIFDTIEKKYLYGRTDHLSDIRYKSVMRVAENFKYEKEHSLHTAELALKIFDGTEEIHKLGKTEREYLEAASVLHEVGSYISHSQHHRHSYYLIRNSELLGFTENEKEIIANTARYHRKSHPKLKHEDFAKLSSEDQMTVKKLASILRIADGLDRTHSSVVKDIRCVRTDGELKILIHGNGDSSLELEIWGAERKKGLFEETFGMKVRVEEG